MPKSFEPTGELVRRMFIRQRLANALSKDVLARLDALFAEIQAELHAVNPTAVDAEIYRRARVAKLVDEVRELVGDAIDDALKATRAGAAAIGAAEAKWAADLLERSLGNLDVTIAPGAITTNKLKVILDTDPILGEHLADTFERLGETIAANFRREVQLGMSASETIDEISARVRERVMDTSRTNADTLVRTAVQDISNTSLMETWKANDDVVKRYRFVATLEGRTCPQCGALDGEEFDFDDPKAPVPPLHMRCRCTTVPVIDWEGLGVEAPAPGTRASEDGPVDARMDFEDWLREQSPEYQAEILGDRRAALFRSGEVDLRELVRTDGGLIPLEELS